MFTTLLFYVFVGGIAGVAAGLLGIGGGLIIVPLLSIYLEHIHIPHHLVMHLTLGTSMASIMFTSVSSFLAHNRRGAVDWSVVKRITVGILLGSYLGTCIASVMSTGALKGFFGIFLYFVAWQMLSGKKPKPSRQLPGLTGMAGAGGVIGTFSSLVGIGGGTLSVPFLVWHNVPIHRAIGTSAAIGFPLAIAATVGYIVNGWGVADLPPYSLGYVSLTALASISVMSVSTAPLGVRLAHSLPIDKLKRVFACILLLVGTKMIYSIL